MNFFFNWKISKCLHRKINITNKNQHFAHFYKPMIQMVEWIHSWIHIIKYINEIYKDNRINDSQKVHDEQKKKL